MGRRCCGYLVSWCLTLYDHLFWTIFVQGLLSSKNCGRSKLFAFGRGEGVGINIALHAQVRPSTKMVVGSAVTTAGMRQAFLSRRKGDVGMSNGKDNSNGHVEHGVQIGHVQVFYPFEYDGLHDRHWDLVIIEGWFKMINAFIHEVRALSHPRPVIILFYCLDPIFPGISYVSALDVDGFLTNSERVRTVMLPTAPISYVPLAVDIRAFPFYPGPPYRVASVYNKVPEMPRERVRSSTSNNDSGGSNGRVVYVGAAGAIPYKNLLLWILREAAPYGLDIYGSGWQEVPGFSEYWRGVLPERELASVYGAALAVIGVTMDAQREMGMINNRVFEALSVGAPLISDHFPALEDVFGDLLLYARQPGDVARHIEDLLLFPGPNHSQHAGERGSATEVDEQRRKRRCIIEEHHTWAHRMEEVLSFAVTLAPKLEGLDDAQRSEAVVAPARCSPNLSRIGTGCLTLAIVLDQNLAEDVTFTSTLVPAVDLLGSMYRVTWWMTRSPSESADFREGKDDNDGNTREGASRGNSFHEPRQIHTREARGYLGDYDIVWAAGRWGGLADRMVRGALDAGEAPDPRTITPRLAAQLRGVILWGPLCTPNQGLSDDHAGSKRYRTYEAEPCPDFAGQEGLRWYDVVFCQTGWDHSLLSHSAFSASLSDKVQQAWGFEARVSSLPSSTTGGDRVMNDPPAIFDTLVIGGDDQIPGMLEAVDVPGLGRAALVIITSLDVGVDMAAWPGLASTLAASNMSVGTSAASVVDVLHRESSQPSQPSQRVLGLRDDPTLTSRAVEMILIQSGTDVSALAELLSHASTAVVVATEGLGAWATLITAVQWQQQDKERSGRRELKVIDPTGIDGDRIRALADQRPGNWDLREYSRLLVEGMTRAFCLGLGNSRVSLVRPVANAERIFSVDDTINVEARVENFEVGRDGQWCVVALDRVLLCVLQTNFLQVDVRVTSSVSESNWDRAKSVANSIGAERDGEVKCGANRPMTTLRNICQDFLRIELWVELRSNVYGNILHRSKPSTLLVHPLETTTFQSAYGCTEIGGGVTALDCSQDGSDRSQSAISNDREGVALGATLELMDFIETGTIVRRSVHVPAA